MRILKSEYNNNSFNKYLQKKWKINKNNEKIYFEEIEFLIRLLPQYSLIIVWKFNLNVLPVIDLQFFELDTVAKTCFPFHLLVSEVLIITKLIWLMNDG